MIRNTIFTTEHSVCTGIEAVYTLLNIDRGVPEVRGNTYDTYGLLNTTVQLRDGKKVTGMDQRLLERLTPKVIPRRVEGTDAEELLKECRII